RAVGRLLVTFTVFTNAPQIPERVQALNLVRTARLVPPGPPWRTAEGGFALELPGKHWRLSLDLPGYEIGPVEMLSEGRGVTFAGENPKTGMILSAFLEKARSGWTAADYREDYWKRISKGMHVDRKEVQRAERGEMVLLQFRVPKVEGLP